MTGLAKSKPTTVNLTVTVSTSSSVNRPIASRSLEVANFGRAAVASHSKRAHLRATVLQTPPKIHEKTPKKERKKIWAREGKNWFPTLRGPTASGLAGPTLRPTLRGPPFGAPRGSTMTHTSSKNRLAKIGFGQNCPGQNHDGQKNGLAKIGQIRMAKTGLAKVGLFQ